MKSAPLFPTAALLLVLGAVFLAPPARAQAVPPDNQALLILRILAFDRKVATRATDGVVIAVVYKPGNGDSEQAHKDISKALDAAGHRTTVAGQNVKVVSVPYSPTLEADLQKAGAVAAYVCSGLDDSLDPISHATRARGVLTFSGAEAYARAVLAVAIIRKESKAAILVNLKASRAEGADLDSGLLQIAEVVR